jgi:hypothetical protein
VDEGQRAWESILKIAETSNAAELAELLDRFEGVAFLVGKSEQLLQGECVGGQACLRRLSRRACLSC